MAPNTQNINKINDILYKITKYDDHIDQFQIEQFQYEVLEYTSNSLYDRHDLKRYIENLKELKRLKIDMQIQIYQRYPSDQEIKKDAITFTDFMMKATKYDITLLLNYTDNRLISKLIEDAISIYDYDPIVHFYKQQTYN
jgi:hypothetical protein